MLEKELHQELVVGCQQWQGGHCGLQTQERLAGATLLIFANKQDGLHLKLPLQTRSCDTHTFSICKKVTKKRSVDKGERTMRFGHSQRSQGMFQDMLQNLTNQDKFSQQNSNCSTGNRTDNFMRTLKLTCLN